MSKTKQQIHLEWHGLAELMEDIEDVLVGLCLRGTCANLGLAVGIVLDAEDGIDHRRHAALRPAAARELVLLAGGVVAGDSIKDHIVFGANASHIAAQAAAVSGEGQCVTRTEVVSGV